MMAWKRQSCPNPGCKDGFINRGHPSQQPCPRCMGKGYIEVDEKGNEPVRNAAGWIILAVIVIAVIAAL